MLFAKGRFAGNLHILLFFDVIIKVCVCVELFSFSSTIIEITGVGRGWWWGGGGGKLKK